jgi:hypothetical protein
MADLSTLDATQPPDTQAVSQGAARIRETRAAILGSFGTTAGAGGTQTEHFWNGVHKFPNGAVGARPAAGNSGRLFINNSANRFQLDNGSSWVTLHPISNANNTAAGPTSIIDTNTYASVTTATLDYDNQIGLIVVSADCAMSAGAVGQVEIRDDTAAATVVTYTLQAGSGATSHIWPVAFIAVTTLFGAASVTYNLRFRQSVAGQTMTINRRSMIILGI